MSSPTQTEITTETPGVQTRERGATVPMWLVMLMFLLLYWGAVYFDEHGGWFSPRVYAPYTSIRELEGYVIAPGPGSGVGKRIFESNCALCHGTQGEGKAGQGPPLAGSEWVSADPGKLIRIPLYGLTGPITVKGQSYNLSMAAMGAGLSNDDLAAVLSYIRSSWGNSAEPITPDQVEAVRQEVGTRGQAFTAQELGM